jgi:hypothetical protein
VNQAKDLLEDMVGEDDDESHSLAGLTSSGSIVTDISSDSEDDDDDDDEESSISSSPARVSMRRSIFLVCTQQPRCDYTHTDACRVVV